MHYTSTPYEQQFAEQFELVEANTAELISMCKKLRYQIYCEERGHLSADSFVKMEEDHYDEHSIQTLLRDKVSNEYIATVRLILSHKTEKRFHYPLEEHIDEKNHEAIDMINSVPKDQTAEISRFSISKQFRKRYKNLTHVTDKEHGPRNSRNIDALITIGLFKAITKMSVENNVTNWLAFMEPSLLRLLSRLGVSFDTHGPLLDYCGKRYPCKNTVEDVLNGIKKVKPEVWRLITDNGKVTYHQFTLAK